MDPAYLNPIMPVFPDVAPALVLPALLAAVAGCAGLGAVVVLVIRSEAVRRRGVESILDAGTSPVVDTNAPPAARRSGRRSFVQWVRREINVREIRVGPALRR